MGLLNDKETDGVYFSAWLKRDFEEVYKVVCKVLDQYGVWHGVLEGTQDYWCRDYMPVQTAKGQFVRYRYCPDYLSKGLQQYMTDPKDVCDKLREAWWAGVVWQELELVVDGGNVVKCGDVVVMTEKVFAENPDVPRGKVHEMLEEAFGAEVLFLPWDSEEKYGHSDGVVRYVGDGRVVMTNYRDFDRKMAEEMWRRLERRFEVVELAYSSERTHPDCWVYVNFLQTEQVIVVPGLGIKEDREALEQLRRLFPEYGERVVQVDARPLVKRGGAWNCVSWNVKRFK